MLEYRFQRPVAKINNGEKAKNGEFPWAVKVAVWNPKGCSYYTCQGVIIGPGFILTSGTCELVSSPMFYVDVEGGFVDGNTQEKYSKRASEFFVSSDGNLKLIKLRDMTYMDNTKSICLPDSNTVVPNPFTTFGYSEDEVLVKANLYFTKYYGTNKCPTGSYLCSFGFGNKNTCLEGWTAVIDSKWTLIGSMKNSDPHGDCTAYAYSQWVDVRKYLDWICENQPEFVNLKV